MDALLIVRTRINDTRVALARQHHIPFVAYGRTETSEPYLLHMPDEQIFGAVEAGGTKFICAVGRGVHEMLEERRIATRQPAETLAEVRQFFHAMQLEYGRMRGFGIASFGPIQLDRRAHDWGRMLATPKPGWANANLITALQPVADCAIGLDTDVNAAALAEAQLGTGQGCSSVAYVTVGTGIGAGVAIDNQTLRGRMHPEMGHIHMENGLLLPHIRNATRKLIAGYLPAQHA